ncbi:MAG: XRE family transcriptional regulator [Clostridia bacterium]|nr:XRE family transcriptional regulator [Clostridia bacterium]
MSVGANIKKRRYELKMSQQELADAMGYKTRSTIAKIESGENDVSHRKLHKFAAVLDTTAEALLSGSFSATYTAAESESIKGKNTVIVLAGGKSGRNRQNIPSQFINVNGRPILMHTLMAYQEHPAIGDIYVVCLKGWENIARAYAEQFKITKLKGIITGGNSGIDSLKNGIDGIKHKLSPNDLIIIQESTRPMVTGELISALIRSATEKGSATVCHSMNDYVQFDTSAARAKYVDRNAVIALQSPEAHKLSVIDAVFKKAKLSGHTMNETCFTMLMYNLGYNINFIEGNINNIKITREEDIAAFAARVRDWS